MVLMNKQRTTLVVGLALLLVSLITAGVLSAGLRAQASGNTQVKLPPPKVRNFTLYVRDTMVKMPDGRKIYVFGYTDNPKGHAKVPGPTLVVNEGDTVNVTLVDDHDPTYTKYNPGGDGHTIHLHGLDLPTKYDGDPMTAPG